MRQNARRLPFSKVEEVKDLLRDMQEKDVIEPSSSPLASPMVWVRKKDGSTRYCVNYRRLNDITKRTVIPFPESMIHWTHFQERSGLTEWVLAS
ncbi:hypothetical protein AVEN_120872-1 [Araneus ventricosus]|uniref:Transposon Ty3-I Gag-Pol polyprotein n=1 Tax=Araneus ventricosus TaxID=182803 RepID=A0A4Y2K2F4_ARAVE|nr:hypothetical protein AVEN_120872-1 [Araneus ventricosus]